MLIIGLVVAAVLGPIYLARTPGYRTPRRLGIGGVVAVAGAAITPLAMGQCGFADETSGVDHLLTYGLMVGGAWLALVITKTFFDRADGEGVATSSMTGEIRSGGFNLGAWVPWALLAPSLIILLVFLYAPAAQTFTLSTKLARLGAPRSLDVCLGNFTELLITDPFRLVAYPLIAIAAIYGVRWWRRSAAPGSLSHRTAELASILAMLSVFVALYAIFSPDSAGGQVAYRPVYVNTVIISVGIVIVGMAGGLAIACCTKDIHIGQQNRARRVPRHGVQGSVN